MNFKSLEVIPNFYSTFVLKAPFLSSFGYSSSENKMKVGIQVQVAYVKCLNFSSSGGVGLIIQTCL